MIQRELRLKDHLTRYIQSHVQIVCAAVTRLMFQNHPQRLDSGHTFGGVSVPIVWISASSPYHSSTFCPLTQWRRPFQILEPAFLRDFIRLLVNIIIFWELVEGCAVVHDSPSKGRKNHLDCWVYLGVDLHRFTSSCCV